MIQKNSKQTGLNKNRRTLKQQRNVEKKSYNLKQLHQSFCEEFDQHYRIAQRASAAQLQMQNRQNGTNTLKRSEKKPKRESSVNFYINIDKLKNLKISNKDKGKYDSMSAYLNNSKNLHNNRKSLYMKYAQNKKSAHHSFQHQKNNASSLQYQKNHNRSVEHNSGQNVYQKGKVRYKTQEQQKNQNSQSSLSKGFMMKRNNFRRTKNNQVKDKTFIEGYLKGKQLGRGGFSKVWEGFHFETKVFYAVKQIDTQNKYQTHLTQIWFGNYFFTNGQPKKQFSKHPGIGTLITMYHYEIVDPRAFIVYENCDGSLGNLLYDIYEEDGKDDVDDDDKLYMIKYKKLYGELRKSTNFLKCMIYEISQALDLLVSNKIIHSDLKTENILLKKNDSNGLKFKLIDYGSSFMFQSLKQYKLATPEYMCPQLLNYILYENKKDHHPKLLSYMKDYKNISSIDVWSFGCIILQLIHGLPLWLTNPTKIYVSGKYQTKKGLFAVSDRSFSKILERQLYIVQNIDSFLERNNNSGIMIDDKLRNILVGMLNPNPQLRLRPSQIISMLKNS